MPRAPKSAHLAPPVAAVPNLFVGTSGWAYPTWKPGFYPKQVPPRAFLQSYATRLTSVEVNYTFRKAASASQLKDWLAATPAGFRFSFKAPQRITHFQRLRDSHPLVAEFVASLKPVRPAGMLGPLLFQLPPNFAADHGRLKEFLKAPSFRRNRLLQVAFEFRHESWFSNTTYDMLRHHNVALCVADGDSLQTPDIQTADFCCYRLRRSGGYSASELKKFAAQFSRLAVGSEVYVYFRHEDEPTGAHNATALLAAASRLDNGSRA